MSDDTFETGSFAMSIAGKEFNIKDESSEAVEEPQAPDIWKPEDFSFSPLFTSNNLSELETGACFDHRVHKKECVTNNR